MRFFGLGEFSLCPETHFKGIFKFKGGGGGLMAVCGLDHCPSFMLFIACGYLLLFTNL